MTNSQRRRFSETQVQNILKITWFCQHLHLNRDAPLLGKYRRLQHIQHCGIRPQLIQSDGKILWRLVVNLESQFGNPVSFGYRLSRFKCQQPQHVADAGEVSGSEAAAVAKQTVRLTLARLVCFKIIEYRCASRSNPFAGNTIIAKIEAFQQQHRCRRRHWQIAVCRLHPATALRQGSDRPARIEPTNQERGTDDVGN